MKKTLRARARELGIQIMTTRAGKDCEFHTFFLSAQNPGGILFKFSNHNQESAENFLDNYQKGETNV